GVLRALPCRSRSRWPGGPVGAPGVCPHARVSCAFRTASVAGRAAYRKTRSPPLHPTRRPRRAAHCLSHHARVARILLVVPHPAGGPVAVGFRRALSLAAARAGYVVRRRRTLFGSHGTRADARRSASPGSRSAPCRRGGAAAH